MTEILERVWQFIPDLLVDRLRDADPVRLRQSFEPRGDIDAVAVDVLGLGNHVAEVDADAQTDALVLYDIEIAAAHRALHLDRAGHRRHPAAELHQPPLPRLLDIASG